jgi:hypothetical protein
MYSTPIMHLSSYLNDPPYRQTSAHQDKSHTDVGCYSARCAKFDVVAQDTLVLDFFLLLTLLWCRYATCTPSSRIYTCQRIFSRSENDYGGIMALSLSYVHPIVQSPLIKTIVSSKIILSAFQGWRRLFETHNFEQLSDIIKTMLHRARCHFSHCKVK